MTNHVQSRAQKKHFNALLTRTLITFLWTWIYLSQGLSVLETVEENSKGGFNGDFHMEFCDNKQQLFQAYFREFHIEEMNSPWKAFTDGWHSEITAKKLGINSSYIVGDYRFDPLIVWYKTLKLIICFDSYVLVRVSRFRERARLQRPIAPNQLIDPGVLAKINNITVGDTVSVLQFIQKYGTHYINSYVTGNSLYQVKRSLWHFQTIVSP